MKGEERAKGQYLQELAELRRQLAEASRRIAELETTCKQANSALRDSQVELSAIFNSAPLIMVLMDQERRVRKANRAAVESVGRPVEEMIGLRGGEALRCLNSLDDPRGCGFGPSCEMCVVRRTVLDTFETGSSHYQVEGRLPLASGERQEQRSLLVSTTPITVAESQLVLASIEDITEYKRVEEEISWLARFPGENPNPVLRVARDCTILYANEASRPLLETWGRQAGECLPDEWHEIILDILSSSSSRDVEVDCRDRTFSLTFAPVVEADYANVYGLDITARKRAEEALVRSEERYTLAQQAANIGSWDWSIRTGALHWSDRIEPMFGFGRGEFGATYETFLESVHPEDRQYVIDSVDACLEKGKEYAIEHRIVWPDGTVRWVFETGDVFRDETGEAIRMLGIVQDITDRKRVEETLRQYAVELETRNNELGAFAHTVAHDLKNPLGLVVGYAQTLEQDHAIMPGEKLRDSLQSIARTALRMNNIIDELLLLAELREAEVETVPLDMAGIVAEARQRLGDKLEAHQAEIVSPETWPVALGYGPWIEEVWANYLDNAIKYGGQPPRIELGAETQPDGMMRFWVHDNGSGLTAEEQTRLFTPFTRLDQVHAKGHGLGLSIVRRIVEKLGGQVGVKSEPGQGSIFTFTLPGSSQSGPA
jgi:PAS domain S-box-containing protein